MRKVGTSDASPRLKRENGAQRHGPFSESTLSLDFFDETVAFWQLRAGRRLNREDAREIAHNLSGFFSVLREWRRADECAAEGGGLTQNAPSTDNAHAAPPGADL